jgi:Mg-chelatase subunit ChlD
LTNDDVSLTIELAGSEGSESSIIQSSIAVLHSCQPSAMLFIALNRGTRGATRHIRKFICEIFQLRLCCSPMQTLRTVATISILVSCALAQQPRTCRFSVPVSVSDRRTHEPVSGLTLDSFSIRVGKKEIRPVAVSNVTANRVFLFIDASGSMVAYRARWAAVSQAVKELLSATDKNTPVVTEVFAESSRIFHERDHVHSYLDELARVPKIERAMGKRTKLYDALASAVESTKLGIQDTVFVLTDGVDNMSKVDKFELMRELRSHSIRPNFLVPDDMFGTYEEAKGRSDVAEIAKGVGGLLFWLRSPDTNDAAKILPPTLYSETLYSYRVEFTATESRDHFRVLIPSSSEHSARTLNVRATNRLPDCPEQ